MLGLALILLACILSAVLGVAWGRETERRTWTTDRLAPERKKAFEADVRARRGLRRMHPDPDNAPRVSRARMRR